MNLHLGFVRCSPAVYLDLALVGSLVYTLRRLDLQYDQFEGSFGQYRYVPFSCKALVHECRWQIDQVLIWDLRNELEVVVVSGFPIPVDTENDVGSSGAIGTLHGHGLFPHGGHFWRRGSDHDHGVSKLYWKQTRQSYEN